MRCDSEVAAIKAQLVEEKALSQESARKHRAELDGLKNDIAEKVSQYYRHHSRLHHTPFSPSSGFLILVQVPKIVSTAVERVESQLALRVEKEVSSAKLRCVSMIVIGLSRCESCYSGLSLRDYSQ